jgi:ABC-2 type transport system ATP-binding protein
MQIQLEGLRRTYGGKGGVQDVRLAVPEGAIYTLCGANGSGKTTTLSVLVGLLFAEQGRLSLGGVDVPLHLHRPRAGLGFVPDNPVLDEHLSAWQWLHFIGSLKRVTPSADAAALARVLCLEEGMLAEPIRALSYGNRRKVAIWAEMLTALTVLVLDEPLIGLDPVSIAGFHQAALAFVAQGRSLLLSTHLLREAEALATHVGFIHDGRTVVEGALPTVCAGRSLQDAFVEMVAAGGREAAAHA